MAQRGQLGRGGGIRLEGVLDLLRARQPQLRFPISGYTTAVNWGASAILEFTYLDLIFSKGLSPAAAADQVVQEADVL